ncbi:MAG: FapA family protein, partial [Clostridia bacterium]|nr:FapA family protein [Clostridia bacterium]
MALLLYKNEYIEISREAGLFYIKSTARGLSLEQFNKILRDSFPNVKIASFIAIKNVLMSAPSGPEAFGEERDRVTISITDDALKAYMTLYVADDDLSSNKRVSLVKEIFDALSKAGIVYGIKTNLLAGTLKSGTEYLIAEGLPATNGHDAQIKMYEIQSPQPQVIDSGKVNHYELNLINRVHEGDWLGERKDPTPGIPGKNVKGKEILPVAGRNLPLLYDRVSVREDYQNNVTTLYAKKTGAVYFKGDAVGVYDFLEIKGDINFSTGNIDFDGFLSVKGTVEDNFSVVANKDVEILGEFGVGAADKITSREGNIYIKGGIAGKGKALV